MARPVRRGLSYFPMDVDFFEKEEVKFFTVECGAVGVCALVKLMCNIYREGYYVEWNEDCADLFCWDMRGMLERGMVAKVVDVCLRRKIFDKGVYERYGVLTSREIQEVYVEALGRWRCAEVVKEYWLAEVPKDAKVSGVKGGRGTPVVEGGAGKRGGGKRFVAPTEAEVVAFFREKGYEGGAGARAWQYYEAGGWKDGRGQPVRNWKQKMIAVWMKEGDVVKPVNTEKDGARIEF